MELAKTILRELLDYTLIALSVAFVIFVIVLPFLVVMACFPPGAPIAVLLMVLWALCLFIALLVWSNPWY